MKIYQDTYDKLHCSEPLTVTIGNFDGIHVGHQQLIEHVNAYQDTKHAVITFDPHPLNVIRKQPIKTLSHVSEKMDMFNKLGLDYAFIVQFDSHFSNLSINDFLNFLKRLGVKRVVIGRDARFGYRAEGTVEDLRKVFEVEVIDDLLYQNTRVSTTYVKDLLSDGNLQGAKTLLGRNYLIYGIVVHGNKVGHKLGFPTANIDYNHYFLPQNGVYHVNVTVDQIMYHGMANIGYNPTVNFTTDKRLEIYILDFNQDIYGKTLKIEFLTYLRSESKFKSRKELIDQLKNDEATVRALSQANL